VTSERTVAVQAGPLRLRAVVWGRDGDPTVVLVHGNGAHAHWWAPIVPALVPGWRVVAPDLRGHGESQWPEAAAYRITDFDADLVSVVDAEAPADPIALVGHSMGGRIALWYAAHHRDRVGALAMLDARLDPIVPEEAARYRGKADGARDGRSYSSREAALAAFRYVPDEPDVPPEVTALMAEHAIVERRPGDWTFRFDRGVLDTSGDAAGDLRRLLPQIGCPTLVGNGRRSWVLDAAARDRIVAALAHGEGHDFPGGHHFVLSHAALVGGALRRFLDASRAGRG
jgi:pimeloyl-ACP methyl ester carboxylesterase